MIADPGKGSVENKKGFYDRESQKSHFVNKFLFKQGN